MNFDLLFYSVAIPAVLLTGISKGGLGGALGGIAVPLMALAIAPRLAASIMLPILCFTDLVGMRVYFKKWDTRILKVMIPGTLVGISIGTLTFGVLSENDIRLLLGIVTIGFVLWKWLAPQPDSKKDSEPPLDRTKGVLLSALSGFTSFIAHAGGPPITMYLLSKHLSVTCYVGTINIFFALTNAVKLVPYAWLGQFTSQSLLASLTLAPLVPLGVWTGLWMQKRINTVWFFRIAQIGLLITGLTLLYQGLNNLL